MNGLYLDKHKEVGIYYTNLQWLTKNVNCLCSLTPVKLKIAPDMGHFDLNLAHYGDTWNIQFFPKYLAYVQERK